MGKNGIEQDEALVFWLEEALDRADAELNDIRDRIKTDAAPDLTLVTDLAEAAVRRSVAADLLAAALSPGRKTAADSVRCRAGSLAGFRTSYSNLVRNTLCISEGHEAFRLLERIEAGAHLIGHEFRRIRRGSTTGQGNSNWNFATEGQPSSPIALITQGAKAFL